jgi:hypothetical protein
MFFGDRTPLGIVETNLFHQVPTTIPDGRLQLLCATKSRLLQPEDAQKQPRMEDEVVLCQ